MEFARFIHGPRRHHVASLQVSENMRQCEPKTKKKPAALPPCCSRRVGTVRVRSHSERQNPGGSNDHKTWTLFGSGGDCVRSCGRTSIRRRAAKYPGGEHRGDRYWRRGARTERAG